MPAKTERQRRFFGVQLAKIRSGKKSAIDLPKDVVAEFAKKPIKKGQHPPIGDVLRKMSQEKKGDKADVVKPKPEGGRIRPVGD